MKNKLVIAVLALFTCTPLQAATEKRDPIDIAMEEEMGKDPSTAGMVQAAVKAEEKWKKEIDVAVTKLKKEMTSEQFKALETSQQAWRAYREKELETQNALYAAMQGTMWRPVAASKAMALNRERALLLRDYIETVAER
jgi:uncharacterized protein YecT (DUF1311 family)